MCIQIWSTAWHVHPGRFTWNLRIKPWSFKPSFSGSSLIFGGAYINPYKLFGINHQAPLDRLLNGSGQAQSTGLKLTSLLGDFPTASTSLRIGRWNPPQKYHQKKMHWKFWSESLLIIISTLFHRIEPSQTTIFSIPNNSNRTLRSRCPVFWYGFTKMLNFIVRDNDNQNGLNGECDVWPDPPKKRCVDSWIAWWWQLVERRFEWMSPTSNCVGKVGGNKVSHQVTLLMEEILYHLGFIKPCVYDGITYQPQLVIAGFHQQNHFDIHQILPDTWDRTCWGLNGSFNTADVGPTKQIYHDSLLCEHALCNLHVWRVSTTTKENYIKCNNIIS